MEFRVSDLPKSYRLILPRIAISVKGWKIQENVPSAVHVWSQTLKYEDPISVYVHIPFCERRCPFCRFYSVSGKDEKAKSRYLVALEKELLLMSSLIDFAMLNVESVSIGGGTPFELTLSHLSALLAMLERYLNVCKIPDIEYCMEINPHDVTRLHMFVEKLELLRRFNVNRLSFGVQSLDDRVLKANGSRHIVAEVEECICAARKCGFRNVNIDLLFGLLDQSRQSWLDTLQRAYELHPEHITLFSLKTVSCISPLRHDAPKRRIELASWIHIAKRFLADHGYIEYFPRAFICSTEFAYRYEINTFVFKKAVLGFGPGSITWADQFCYRNVRDLATYEELLDSGMFPIDADTIYHPCDNFLSRLAYL
jgi:oxygen-independent coproporphyrinogen-3 oxidase